MVIGRWNYQKKDYEPYRIPDDWKISVYCEDMDELINCPHCGKEIKFGDGYISQEIHTFLGFGYSVCSDCHEEEIEREKNARNNG